MAFSRRHLAKHPAYDSHNGALVCHWCPERFTRFDEFDAHLLTHQPSAEEAGRHMSGRSLRRYLAQQRAEGKAA